MQAPHFAQLVPARSADTVEVLGPTIEFLTVADAADTATCVMRGMMPPGTSVPLHSHADPETYVIVSGDLEALTQFGAGSAWVRLTQGDVFHVPANAPHAFRNESPALVSMILVSTAKISRFFREIGAPVVPGKQPYAPQPERIMHFLRTAERYGYWNATPEQNAEIGLHVVNPA